MKIKFKNFTANSTYGIYLCEYGSKTNDDNPLISKDLIKDGYTDRSLAKEDADELNDAIQYKGKSEFGYKQYKVYKL